MKINTFFGFLSKIPSVFQMPGRWQMAYTGRAGRKSSSGQASGVAYERVKARGMRMPQPLWP